MTLETVKRMISIYEERGFGNDKVQLAKLKAAYPELFEVKEEAPKKTAKKTSK